MGPTAKMDSESESVEQQLAAAQQEISELKLALHNSLSAKETAERSSEVNSGRQLDAAQELKALVYAIGHDLRQPLRSILTSAQLLQRRLPDLPQVQEFASYIVEGAQEISVLVDNLVRFSKAGSGLRRSNVNLKLPVDLAMFKLQPLIKESGATITAQGLPEVSIDESQFTTVFENLLANAIWYRSEKAPEVVISSEERDDDILVSVTDNGCGIETKYQEQIFEPLKRLHGKQIPGVGLGLAICQKIVRAHGGSMWVESDGQNGSVFRFTISM